MDAFHSQHQKHKKRLTQDQVRLLETSFDHGKKLEPERKLHLARELGVPPRQVAIWRLERDVIRLQGELEKAHEMLHALNYANPNPPPIVSTVLSSISCDEGGSTLENNEEFQFENLYASLMGVDGSNWV
ncbi:Homeobox-leucine zipper protein ATHB-52 [Vitis vinifera]|uniref:Homeobox-leucine zipper protein n=1 Tax=Vitis vinifera TaxID=29760 RepID=A0A438H4X8_VITVI|nr:Homeobox-leucine zipper protein ATHB-52 [Vitis vinifera]